MKRWMLVAPLGTALAIAPLGGCPLAGNEGLSDFAETLGISIFDDEDEPGDIDDDDDEVDDEIEDDDDDQQAPPTVPDFSAAKFSNSTK